jgi:hypothetical protein
MESRRPKALLIGENPQGSSYLAKRLQERGCECEFVGSYRFGPTDASSWGIPQLFSPEVVLKDNLSDHRGERPAWSRPMQCVELLPLKRPLCLIALAGIVFSGLIFAYRQVGDAIVESETWSF